MGILGKSIAGTDDTLVYTVPSNKRAVLLINSTNTSNGEIGVTLSITKSDDYKVSGLSIISNGSNYQEIPDILIDDPTGADGSTAEASVANMKIFTFFLDNKGMGYNVGNELTLDDPLNKDTDDESLTITVTSVGSNGEILNYSINNKGIFKNLIASDDNCTFSGGTGSGATISADDIFYSINQVQLDIQGKDYREVPNAKIVDTNGDIIGDASLTVSVVSDSVTKYDAIDYNVVLPKGSTFERSSIVLGAGDSIFAKCNTEDALNVFVFGVEEIA